MSDILVYFIKREDEGECISISFNEFINAIHSEFDQKEPQEFTVGARMMDEEKAKNLPEFMGW